MVEASSSKATQINSSTFDAYNTELQGLALEATKIAAGLPSDIAFHRSVDNDYAKNVDICSEKALSLTNRLLAWSSNESSSRSRQGKGKAKLDSEDDVIDKFGGIVLDVLDQLFERADTCLDEYLGHHKPANVKISPTLTQIKSRVSRNGRLDPSITHASTLAKPQLKFRRKVNNTNGSVWSPGLKHKYNAQVPLGYVFDNADTEEESAQSSRRNHPYHYEIKHITYPRAMFEQRDPITYRSFDDVPFTWVETKEGLEEMINKLRQAQEIAVDLEHHSYRSFQGFLCLMQISSREEDFIVDVLKLRDELEELNEIFTNPKILKVFHGAESDIVWLQQDLNLYVVNLFDTYHASKLLDFSKHGLAALLEMYCDFIPDKRYQLADWRIRPLPAEMLHYARSDTHFLLYVYDCLRNALLDRGGSPPLINTALSRSEETSLRTYQHEYYDAEGGSGPTGWDTLAQKWNKAMSGVQLQVFKAVHTWRDNVAREEDESTRYVLPNHYIFQLAEQPPTDMPALFSKFRPVPPLVRSRASELLDVIRNCVKSHEGIASQQGQTVTESKIITKPDTMDVLVTTTNECSSRFGDLWTQRRAVGNVATPSSVFLDNVAGSTKVNMPISTSQSSLFPSGWEKNIVGRASLQYQDVIVRIHKALIVVPTLRNVRDSVSKVELSQTIEPPDHQEDVEDPASEHHVETDVVEDTIVVVGQPRQKKRKRAKMSSDSKEFTPGVQPPKKARNKKDEVEEDQTVEDVEPFDYASAPNLLDDAPAVDTEIKTKASKRSAGKKGRAFEMGDFPAAPRARHEVRSGNQSHTFR